ncbi:glycerophosphoryl diester phosphodiesterase [Pedobacter sp. MC2016-14]|uniref:glycerophosphoryl diester phosphodiesterase n=1 Tax=Pedobacter sp. MC2016-14 TaxID=2897327 RepID=UPI001E2FE36B|nr:glycerophosphoryl diester phosphodiesterase [Pedobacter sp. MC2016-14]MCD0486973.1 glycerophosphoryl diester phosphodiesterase [Pedobacter sp. MC2016-14]
MIVFSGLAITCALNIGWQNINSIVLNGSGLDLRWEKSGDGWHLAGIMVKSKNSWIKMPHPDGNYTLLYSAYQPDTAAVPLYRDNQKINFPEPVYRYITSHWAQVTQPVQLNTAGKAYHFYPKHGVQNSGKELRFSEETAVASVNASWQIDPVYAQDVLVIINIKAKKSGYFSIASPSLATVLEKELAWGLMPGYFQGAAIEKDFVKAYAYGQGIPDQPVVVRERTASTLSPLISSKNGLTMAVIPQPGTGRNPWDKDKNTHNEWLLGLSLMNRKAALTPTVYHPVLGQKGSYLKTGESSSFTFRYSLQATDWYPVFKHAVYDIYHFKDFLALKQTAQSLTDRILAMHKYVTDDKTSMWRTETFKDLSIGAQAYLGGVLGSDKDAMKNSDYGAMWMLANIMKDSVLQQERLPFARNFKLLQQQAAPGFFEGAATGQYYLSKSKKFTEEWGPYVEPIGLTYYTLMDIGNILLFQPNDAALKAGLRKGADRLLSWQQQHGGWAIAYDHASEKKLFTELEDLRPTFYGMLVAYQILGDEKYLQAACKGADWYIEHAVNKGHFLGVCGDTRFVPDFATGQSIQALLTLHEVTKNKAYLAAAIKTARFYTTSVYTHPIPDQTLKMVKGKSLQDWEISQVGLSFEHGGSIGSANSLGPILLASHAGLFVRLFQLTKDSIYVDMARAAALGRDAFVDKKTSVASYYWTKMDAGPGSFPHHAWWQIGWITDYLLSETELRSEGGIKFPRGFITPKVGPHQSYGFAPGQVYGIPASLMLVDGLIKADNPYLDYTQAINSDQKKCFLTLLNNSGKTLKTQVHFNPNKIPGSPSAKVKNANWLTATGKTGSLSTSSTSWPVEIAAYGLKVIEIEY